MESSIYRQGLSSLERLDINDRCEEKISDPLHDDFIKKIQNLMESISPVFQIKPISVVDADNFNFEKVNHSLFHAYLKDFTSPLLDLFSSYDNTSMTNSSRLNRLLSSDICVLYLTFRDQDQVWSCSTCCENVIKLMTLVCKLKKGKPVAEVLSSEYLKIHEYIVSNLKRDTWKCYPTHVQVFNELVKHSDSSSLSERLGLSAPLILKMIDDYNSKYSLAGISLLNYLLANLPAADMRIYGWSNVFYDALYKRLFNSDHEILDAILPALLSCLKTLRPKVSRKLQPEELVLVDKTLEQMVSNCFMTSDGKSLQCYFRHLPDYFAYMGVEVIGHLKQLTSLYSRYLEEAHSSYMPELLNSLDCLIKVAWIRINGLQLFQDLLKAMVRLDCSPSSKDSLSTKSTYAGIYRCIQSLITVDDTHELETALKELKSLDGWELHLQNIFV